jgi:Glycosyl hydrolases family 32 C terminal
MTLSLIGKLDQSDLPDPLVRFDISPAQISVDGEQVSLADLGPGADPEALEMHIYVDGSVAEIILNRAVAFTKRFYYKGAEAPSVTLHLEGQADTLHVSMWQIAPISADRLTS